MIRRRRVRAGVFRGSGGLVSNLLRPTGSCAARMTVATGCGVRLSSRPAASAARVCGIARDRWAEAHVDNSNPSGCPACGHHLLDPGRDARCPECGAIRSVASVRETAVARRICLAARAVASAALVATSVLALIVVTESRHLRPASETALAFACCGFLVFPPMVATALFWWAAPGLSSRARRRVMAAWAALGGVAGALAVLVTFLSAWLGDWGRIKTGSSTAGIAFVFLPVWELIAGAIGAIVGLVIGALVASWRPSGAA